MSLNDIVKTLGLALSLSMISPSYVQGQSSFASIPEISSVTTSLDTKEYTGIPKPAQDPDVIIDLRAHRKILGIDFSKQAGIAEIRKNSLYIDLLSGKYQLMFEQINDSTFLEHLFTVNLEKNNNQRYELFTTVRRKESLVLKNYEVLIGTPREEKLYLEHKVYSGEFLPIMMAVNKFFENTLNDNINVVAFGVKYTFNLYRTEQTKQTTQQKKTDEKIIIRTAKMTELIKRTPEDIILMEENLYVFTTEKNMKDTTIIELQKIEADFAIVNSGMLWNSNNYKATGKVRK